MKLIYIAAPFTPRDGTTVEGNVRAAEAVAIEVGRIPGLHPVCPHSTSRVLWGIQEEPAAYAGTMELMRRCDAVLAVAGGSTGVAAEICEAVRLDKPIFVEWADFIAWAGAK
jgi:nucleoside 2-deoxyribosyltransferase